MIKWQWKEDKVEQKEDEKTEKNVRIVLVLYSWCNKLAQIQDVIILYFRNLI